MPEGLAKMSSLAGTPAPPTASPLNMSPPADAAAGVAMALSGEANNASAAAVSAPAGWTASPLKMSPPPGAAASAGGGGGGGGGGGSDCGGGGGGFRGSPMRS